MLDQLRLPAPAVQLVRSLYRQHKGRMSLEGSQGESIPLSAGIRQGCPLSALLDIIAIDGLLRRVALEPGRQLRPHVC